MDFGGSMENDKVKRKRLKRGSGGCMPTIVCTASGLADKPGAIELALVLMLLVFGVYFIGFIESLMSLPSVPGIPNFRAHMGANLNLAHIDEWDWEDGDDSEDGDDGADKKPQKQQQQEQQNDGAGGRGAANVVSMSKVLLSPPKNADAVPISPAVFRNPNEIPKGKWPVTLHDELDNFEVLIHPGDGVTQMSVPKFWSYPVHNGGLMSRETAMKIGTCIEPDANGNYNRGDDCPVDKRTIYVGIASYRDFECRSTAESIFLRAKNPDRIRIGVVDQIIDGEDAVCHAPIVPCDQDPNQGLCKYRNQIDVYEMEAQLSIGPVFARHIGYRMYRGEYYATQSDAHVTYTQDWDADIISQLEATKDEMAVLSTYLTDVQGSIDKDGNSLRDTRPIMCNTYYEGGPQGLHLRHGSQPERLPSIHGMPQLQPWWAAGYSFSRGHFVVNVPYDWLQPMIFQGEEMSIGIRGFTVGYDYYAPERSVCFHHYAVGENAAIRNKVHHFWENTNNYAGTGKKAMQRLLGIVRMTPEVDPSVWDHTEEDIYGIGGARTPEKFYEMFGIHVREKRMERHLCSFVDTGGRMHKEFTQFLRPDGMGIDYSKISFQFTDPRPDEE